MARPPPCDTIIVWHQGTFIAQDSSLGTEQIPHNGLPAAQKYARGMRTIEHILIAPHFFMAHDILAAPAGSHGAGGIFRHMRQPNRFVAVKILRLPKTLPKSRKNGPETYKTSNQNFD